MLDIARLCDILCIEEGQKAFFLTIQEMKTIGEYLFYAAAGVFLLLGAGYWYTDSGFDFRQVLMLILGLTFVVSSIFLLHRDAKDVLKRRRKSSATKKQWQKPARIKVDLPFDMLAANFAELASKTEEAEAEENILTWSSGAFADICIQKLNEDAWIALFWLNSDNTLTDRQVDSICKREEVDFPEHFRKRKAQGVAIFQQACLSLYPGTLKEDFEDAFLTTVLQEPTPFSHWLEEYTE